jgi:hypothetical protein
MRVECKCLGQDHCVRSVVQISTQSVYELWGWEGVGGMERRLNCQDGGFEDIEQRGISVFNESHWDGHGDM